MEIKAIKINKLKIKEIINPAYEPFKTYQSNYEIVYKFNSEQFIVIYAFGAYVLFNIDEDSIKTEPITAIISQLGVITTQPSLNEVFEVEIDGKIKKPQVFHNKVVLPNVKLDYVRIISVILAQSVTLDSLENETDQLLIRSAEKSRQLEKGEYPKNTKKLLQNIGFVMAARQEILGNLYIYDVPDEAFDNITLEKMFSKLKDVFDIEARFSALSLGLDAVKENIEIIINLLHVRRATAMELWIIALITIEILMSLSFHIWG